MALLSIGQNLQAFNEVYAKTYLETSQRDMKKALKVADSLFEISETPLLQTKSLMLSATLYNQSGEVQKSIDYALRAGTLIEPTDNRIWQSKVFGFLASQYRMLQLYDYSKVYLDKAFSIGEMIDNPEAANNVKGLMKQEKAYYEIEQKNYKKAIQEIKSSQRYFDLTKANADFFRTNNEQLLGLSYYHLKDFKSALHHYQLALHSSKSDPENFMVGLVYNGYTRIYLDQNDLKNAKKYLSLAQKISDQSQFLALKNEVYTTSQKYYAATKNVEKLVSVKERQDSVVEKMDHQSKAFINQSFKALEKDKVVSSENSVAKNWIILTCILLLFAGSIYFVRSRNQHQKSLAHFKKIIANFDEKAASDLRYSFPVMLSDDDAADVVVEMPKTEVTVTMTAETEKKIIDKLAKFEASQLFIDNKISLSTLATYCDTNTKYLSYIINTHKKKDFNNYVNNLRIRYIVKKLIEVPLYRRYKIGVLSEEAGFSSQNKFSTVFKKKTSISPSDFIRYLEEIEKV